MTQRSLILLFAVLLLFGWACGASQALAADSGKAFTVPHPPNSPTDITSGINMPPLRMVSPGVLEVGGCRIFKRLVKVEFPAEVNMAKGLLEYLVVGSSGKLHESLLRTNVEPYSLQIALLLLGLEGTLEALSGQGDPETPRGEQVSIWVRWNDGSKTKQAPIEQWVKNGQKPLGRVPWVFTGSVVQDGVFMAQVEKSMVAVFHDPTALIDHQLEQGASDEIWFVDETKVLPEGTEVTVIIEKALQDTNAYSERF